MLIQKDNETRLMYLLRVAEAYIDANPYHIIAYDDAECDGYCLAEELRDLREDIESNIQVQESEIQLYKELCK
jgi:hypothetical protein